MPKLKNLFVSETCFRFCAIYSQISFLALAIASKSETCAKWSQFGSVSETWGFSFLSKTIFWNCFIAFKITYSCCFSYGGNQEFRDFLEKKFYNINYWFGEKPPFWQNLKKCLTIFDGLSSTYLQKLNLLWQMVLLLGKVSFLQMSKFWTNNIAICGQSYKHFTIVIYDPRAVIWSIFKSGRTLERKMFIILPSGHTAVKSIVSSLQ